MEEYIIRKEDGSIVKWNKTKNNGYFCLLHYDNRQKYSFSPVQNLKCQLFMIGGGGAGGYFFGGGGGAGAAYINNNYIFEKTKSYSFEIGKGGRCDIDNINNLFKSGLNLKVFNNTNPNLDRVSFTYDDYTSLGITSASIVQSFVVNNINIPSTIFNNNTTYIWDGYVKPNDTGFIKVNVNSKIKTIIWVDKYIFNNSSAIVDGININDVKIVQLDSNKFYNIKIIAYNFDTSNSNFNISFENCQLYNFDKTGEIYNYIPATDTNLTYRNNDDNIPNIIKCKAGGFGGCGLYNQNNDLDGGCGGGSGINKINGKSLADPGFNGNDGAVGTYCGGGGGIISSGINDRGGEGKKIEWFSSDLLFGAGGNAATFKETRNLGYGCGGNGAECCYFSKLLANNDGNNGCVLIYVNGSDDIIEGFTGSTSIIGKTDIYLNEDSIVNTLIKESFNILIGANSISSNSSRYNYYDKLGGAFTNLCFNEGPSYISSGTPDDQYTTTTKISSETGTLTEIINNLKYTLTVTNTAVTTLSASISAISPVANDDETTFKNKVGEISTQFGIAKTNVENLTSASRLDVDLADSTAVNFTTTSANITTTEQKIDNAIELATRSPLNYQNITSASSRKTAYDNLVALKKSINIMKKYMDEAKNQKTNIGTYVTSVNGNDNNDMNNYIYDILIISKLYAIVYRLYYHHFTVTLNNDINAFNNFLKNVTYTFTDNATTLINGNNVNINGLFNLNNLKRATQDFNTYNILYSDNPLQPSVSGSYVNMNTSIHDVSKNNIGFYPVPAYHHLASSYSNLLLDIITPISGKINLINPVANSVDAVSSSIGTPLNNGNTGVNNYLNIYHTNSVDASKINLNKASLKSAYNVNNSAFDTNINDYKYQRVAFYLEQFNIILNTNPSILLSTLKYKMFYYNAVVYNVGLQYLIFSAQKSRITNDYNSANSATAMGVPANNVSVTHITDYITKITENLNLIINENINTSTFYTDVVKTINDNSSNIKDSSDKLNDSLENLNDAITKYNNDLEVYNTYLYYYKIIMAIAIAIIIIIVLIFTMNSIDNNTKIMIFASIAIIIIVLFILYNNNLSITTETFETCRRKFINQGQKELTGQIDLTNYKTTLYKYMSYIMVLLSTQSITKNTLHNIDTHINNTVNVRNQTVELNTNKIKNYQNASELLKKSANDYYYFIILIVFSVIILMFGMSLYLLYPNMLLNIFVFAVIPFLILVFYVMYKINRSTRMVENKNYWSVYNPSEKTLATL